MNESIRKAIRRVTILMIALASGSVSAQVGPTYISGRINNVTFAHDTVMIMIDAGVPDNCVGTSYGWLRISAEKKPMIAFVLGLWMRGDAAQTAVTVYTGGLVDGYCRVDQIDPVG